MTPGVAALWAVALGCAAMALRVRARRVSDAEGLHPALRWAGQIPVPAELRDVRARDEIPVRLIYVPTGLHDSGAIRIAWNVVLRTLE